MTDPYNNEYTLRIMELAKEGELTELRVSTLLDRYLEEDR